VRAAIRDQQFGLIDNWLRFLKDLYYIKRHRFENMTEDQKVDLLCELNVKAQVANLCRTTIVQNAWARGQELVVHGWIYSVGDGLLRDLELTVNSIDQVAEAYRIAALEPL